MGSWRGLFGRIPIRFAREGWLFCFITLGVGLAAINTGNNLLYLIFGMLLGLVVASGVLSEISLRGLEVNRYVPSRIFAGRSFLMGISLGNQKQRFPSFSIEVEDLLDRQPLRKRCFFLKVPAGRVQQTSYRHQFPKRGLYRLSALRLSTKFPFALFRKWRDIAMPADVVVFPALAPVVLEDLRDTLSSGDESSNRRGRRGEFVGLRPALQGDDARDIHWRATARTGRLMVREQEDEQQRNLVIVLDNARPAEPPRDARDDAPFERAVSLAAALAVHYAARGFSVGLATRGSHLLPVPGEAQVGRVLRALALLDYASPEIPIDGLPRALRRVFVRRLEAAA